MKLRTWILLSCVFGLSGCSTTKGFNRGEMSEQISVKLPVYNEKDIQTQFEKKPNLPNPFKVGVYFKSPPSKRMTDQGWRWTDKDKALIEELAKDLKAQGVVAEVFPILGHLVQDEDLRALRLTAARHHADALLIVTGTGDIDRYTNNLGWTYAFILPALVIPASQADTLFMSNATLWDVRNEYLYLSAEAEGSAKDTYAAAWGKKDKDLLDEAKTHALANLKGELTKMFKGVKL